MPDTQQCEKAQALSAVLSPLFIFGLWGCVAWPVRPAWAENAVPCTFQSDALSSSKMSLSQLLPNPLQTKWNSCLGTLGICRHSTVARAFPEAEPRAQWRCMVTFFP